MFKMSKSRELCITNKRLLMRTIFHTIPRGAIADFWSAAWELIEAEVRTDNGKFVSSTWRKPVGGRYLWIAIGFGGVEAAYWDRDPSSCPPVVRCGPLFDMVAEVNSRLMAAEHEASTAFARQPAHEPNQALGGSQGHGRPA
jgi:hypothetical protein